MALLPDSERIRSEVILGLGSNIGDRVNYLTYSVNKLRKEAGDIVRMSSVWETEPWGFEAEDLFLNMAVMISTKLDPKSLLEVISAIEKKLGRRRRNSLEYQSRVIDIDILLWEERMIAIPGLQVPHPQIARRRFVLEPLCEIVPEAIHPVSCKTMKDLLSLCTDQSGVRLYSRYL